MPDHVACNLCAHELYGLFNVFDFLYRIVFFLMLASFVVSVVAMFTHGQTHGAEYKYFLGGAVLYGVTRVLKKLAIGFEYTQEKTRKNLVAAVEE